MNISCGIIPYRKVDGKIEFFVAHPTGAKNYWAFCKGHVENGESWATAALREFKEETGVEIDRTRYTLMALGVVQQNPKKTVVAFGVEYPDINPDDCYSNMCNDGITPENDGYRWLTYDELKNITHKTHCMFYEEILKQEDDSLY